MKHKIIIMNALDYSKAEKIGTRLVYYLVDDNGLVTNDKFKGYTEITSFYESKIPFEVLDTKYFNKVVDGEFVSKPNYKNPLRSSLELVSINVDGRSIKLV